MRNAQLAPLARSAPPRRDGGSRAWSHGAATKADDERALLPPGASAPCAFKGAAPGSPGASHRPLFEIAPRRLGASPEAKATGSGGVGPKPARSRLDQFFLGRRADGLRLVPGLLLGRPGVVKAERRPCAHGRGAGRRPHPNPGGRARRRRALEAGTCGVRDRGDRGGGVDAGVRPSFPSYSPPRFCTA